MAESPVSNHNLRKCGVFADKKSIDMFHSLQTYIVHVHVHVQR